MQIEIARFLKEREKLLNYLARENIVPVKAPPWADYPFELRRREKTIRGQIGQHLVGQKTMPAVMEVLGVQDERSCREVRERIKNLRKAYDYR